MGLSRNITYVIHYVVDTFGTAWTPCEWRVRKQGYSPGYGKPTTANIKAHCEKVEASTKADGCNAHLGETRILRAFVVDQRTGETVAEYRKEL